MVDVYFQGGKGKLKTFENELLKMVESQILFRGIKSESVLNAMKSVPRHEFIPGELIDLACSDQPLPIGYGQTISQPYIVAWMTEAADIKPDHRVLEIGTGCGYQTAILAKLANKVFTMEIIEPLSLKAQGILSRLQYTNIHFKIGNGQLGWPEKGPFDSILATAAPEHIPQPLVQQLKTGGKLVIPVGVNVQFLVQAIKKSDGTLAIQHELPVRFVPMTGENPDIREE
ncbi:MAG: protein-L-isoaspartate O-methyltransferase [Candidatus Wallbacteria bacterium HGW-Wallbacteria-1]|jgi:protein-L-isoaspartate(D-aspartate) O-methyltransferase|uniref:Protein-L-isoaspartate O-methyltransferase n=1 Tax=Candidatus Wallbacteria bacterium HGW-Wallbacteria-1 TaxID=2013854 RepID=A0A2N1PM78_9BACT|nr:MAG: protein-L-isoaspartate O-methyltransferase [Candidatus Wallbacteria bacterium HGW-Wallbacteria-1]